MRISGNFIPIHEKEIVKLRKTPQIFADCYLITTLNALSHTTKGKNVLRQNITKAATQEGTAYKIHFPDVYSKKEDVFVTEKEIKNLLLTDEYCNIVEHNKEENPTLKAVEVAMNKMVRKYPKLKSFLSRIWVTSVEDFEFNSPSKFMKMFTGKEPISLNEKTLLMSLNFHKKEALELLKKMEKSKGKHNFVCGSGEKAKKPFVQWHCYVIQNVNLKKDSIKIYDTRENQTLDLTFNQFIKNMKYITGYFSNDLKI